MPLRFRRSVSFGGFRVNFSSCGTSYSFGTRGARIRTGKRGTYVTFSAGGISYQHKISSPDNSPSYDVPSDVTTHTVTSGVTEQLTDAESIEFINELTAKSAKIRLFHWIGLPAIIVVFSLLLYYFQQPVIIDHANDSIFNSSDSALAITAFPDKFSEVVGRLQPKQQIVVNPSTLTNFYSVAIDGKTGYLLKSQLLRLAAAVPLPRSTVYPITFLVILIMFTMSAFTLCRYLHRLDKERKSVDIYYDLHESVAPVYQKFIDHFSELQQSHMVWQHLHAQSTNDLKRNAGASKIVNRIPVGSISAHKNPAPFFTTNIPIPNLRLKNTDLYFLPERLLIKRRNAFAAVFYKNLHLDHKVTQFIENTTVPSDATIIDYTWRYVNKSGGPDKRFNDNRRIAVCAYSEYRIYSATGVNELISTSKTGAFDNFARFVSAIGALQKQMKLN